VKWALLNLFFQIVGLIALLFTLTTEKHLHDDDIVSAFDIATALPTLCILFCLLRGGRSPSLLPPAFVWWTLAVGFIWAAGVVVDVVDLDRASWRRTFARVTTLVTDVFASHVGPAVVPSAPCKRAGPSLPAADTVVAPAMQGWILLTARCAAESVA
jgi:hypothetical protein